MTPKVSRSGYVCFHPFQGRPLFGRLIVVITSNGIRECFHPFQGRPLFGLLELFYIAFGPRSCFHPFQGRPLFGQLQLVQTDQIKTEVVSIPFREDLYSDSNCGSESRNQRPERFPSLSGKTSIRTRGAGGCDQMTSSASFHPFQGRPLFGRGLSLINFYPMAIMVSIPFREDLYSDSAHLD